MPSLRDNLLSVRKPTAAGIRVNFFQGKAIILKNNEVIATAFLNEGLYELEVQTCVEPQRQYYGINEWVILVNKG